MKKTELTKQAIIEQAAEIFNRKGYSGTSMSDLTAATGLTKGSLYGNFENKDDIALAAFDFNIRQISNPIDDIVRQKLKAPEKLKHIVQAFRVSFENFYQKGGCPIMNTAIDAEDTHPELTKRVKRVLLGLKKVIVNIVEQGQKEGDVSKKVEAQQFTTIFISMLEGGNMIAKSTGDKNYFYQAAAHLDKMILQELR